MVNISKKGTDNQLNNQSSMNLNIKNIFNQYGIYFIAAGMIILCSIISPVFFSGKNIINILRQMSFITIVSFAQTLLFITGALDLAIGSTMALTGVLAIPVYLLTGSMPLAVLAAIVLGMICNALSGLAVTKLNLHPFIVTLAAMQVYRGLVLLYTNGIIITQVGDFGKLGQGNVWFIPVPVIAMFIVMAFLAILLRNTKYGRNALATGGNPEAARASGINTKKVIMKAYIIAGAFTGLSGVLMMSRISAGLPTAAQGYELDAVTAAIIGGTAFTGGSGTALGTLIGGLIVGIMNNILTLMGVQSYIQQIIKGLIIVVAVALDMHSQKKRIQES